MGFFDFLKPKFKAVDLTFLSYDTAYRFLPNFAHREFDEFLSFWQTPSLPIGYLLSRSVRPKENSQSPRNQDPAFRTMDGQLTMSCNYYLILFPYPPPYVDLGQDQIDRLLSSGKRPPVLAPFFAAILDDRSTKQRSLYILGQSPTGGTTLRSVTADGCNNNHGTGPEPTITAFLERLKTEYQDPIILAYFRRSV